MHERRFAATSFITFLLAVTGSAALAVDDSATALPRVYSFYQDNKSCSELPGEATKAVLWNGRTWYLTAPALLVSPPAETKRVGTPLNVRPLDVFVEQAVLQGASVTKVDAPSATDMPMHLRLVLAVHSQVALGPGTYSLQSIIAVRLCTEGENNRTSILYVGPKKGVTVKDWWDRRKSERWVNAYRDAFSLAIADALHWAADQDS
jgi:hypothetical protein